MNTTQVEQWLLIFYVANQIASALVQALPAPNGNSWYAFFYKFMNLLVADFKSYAAQFPTPKLPAMKSTTTGEITTTSVPAQTEEVK